MKTLKVFSSGLLALVVALALGTPVSALTGGQVGASGQTEGASEIRTV